MISIRPTTIIIKDLSLVNLSRILSRDVTFAPYCLQQRPFKYLVTHQLQYLLKRDLMLLFFNGIPD